jgi:hypothetical protein
VFEMSEIMEKVESELKVVKSMCETMENAIKNQLGKGLDKVNTHEMYEAVDIYKDLSEVKKNIVETCYKKQIMEAMEEYGEDKEEYEDDYGEVRFYNGQPRSRTSGRYMRRGDGRRRRSYEEPRYHMPLEVYYAYSPEHLRDMDRDRNIMYYPGMSDGNGMNRSMETWGDSRNYSDGYSEGESNGYRRGYEEGSMKSGRNAKEGRSGQRRRTYMEAKETAGNTPEGKQTKIRELENYMNELSTDITEMLVNASDEEKATLKSRMQNLMNRI